MRTLIATCIAASIAAPTIADDHTPSWLFVQTADSASMEGNTLTMPVEREILAFTDRPDRQHAYANAHEFTGLWTEAGSNAFSEDPPNAVLTWADGTETHEAEIVITAAETSDYGRSIVYTVETEAGEKPSADIESASLFIDSTADDIVNGVVVACEMFC